MSPSKGELPGFYRDPKTGKYYREKPGDAATSEKLKKLKKSVVDDQIAERNRKPSPVNNTLTYLRERELRGIGGLPSVRSYYGMRIDSRSQKCNVDLNLTQVKYPGIASVEFIKRGPTSIYGMWNRLATTNYANYSYVVGQIPLKDAVAPSNIAFRFTGDFVVDMCENISHTLVYITNNPDTGLGSLQLVWRTGNDTSSYSHYHSKKSPMFSCSHVVVDNDVHVAVGSEGSIAEYNGLAPNNNFTVSGNVHAVAYDETGQLLLYGTSRGYLGLQDLREEPEENNPSIQVKVEPKSVIDACFLSSDQVIVTGLSNTLQTFDLRSQSCVVDFLGHRHSVKKRPISIAGDMVCVSGADNVIRIWHISGGAPIYEIRPEDSDSAIRGCINGDHKGTYLYYFEGSAEKIFQL